MKTISVSKLKAHLSAELAKVKKGAELVVTDHDMPIATITPYQKKPDIIIRKGTGSLKDVKIDHGIKIDFDPVEYMLEDRKR